MNMAVLNNDTGSVALENTRYDDETFTAAGAKTYPAGTILARLTADEKLVVFVKGGSGGAEVPVAVLTGAFISTGAGDFRIRPCVSGGVRKQRLIIDADGDGSNVDQVVTDGLRDFGIYAQSVTELNILDNQ